MPRYKDQDCAYVAGCGYGASHEASDATGAMAAGCKLPAMRHSKICKARRAVQCGIGLDEGKRAETFFGGQGTNEKPFERHSSRMVKRFGGVKY